MTYRSLWNFHSKKIRFLNFWCNKFSWLLWTTKVDYFIYLTHTTNTTVFILGFYQILRSVLKYLIMEEYETLSCVHIYQNIKKSGWRQWGNTSLRKGNTTKSKGPLCCCSEEGWYHSWPFTTQDFIIKPGLARAWFFIIASVCEFLYVYVCVCVFMCVCVCPRGY